MALPHAFGIGLAWLHVVSLVSSSDAMAYSVCILPSSNRLKTVLDGFLDGLVLDDYNLIVLEGVLMARRPESDEYVSLSLSFSLLLSLSLFVSLSLSLSFSLPLCC